MSEQAILAAFEVENVRANIEHICETIPSTAWRTRSATRAG